MRTRLFAGIWLALALASAPAAPAQAGDPPPVTSVDTAERRAELERTIRERVGQIVRDSLGLSAEQFQQLRQANRRYEEQRRPLLQEERGVRAELRQALQAESPSDQTRVSALMDQLYSVQQRRFNMNQQEQRDLSAFLSPIQRARYAAIQERLRLRMEEMRREQRALGGGARRAPLGDEPRLKPRAIPGRGAGAAKGKRRP